MEFPTALLLANLASTWFMAGLVWFVQLVHYPGFSFLPAGSFPPYHRRHTRFTTYVVLPPMLVELLTSVLLPIFPPPRLPASLLYAGLALTAAVWASTFLLQVPCHNRLAAAFDPRCHVRLLATNWLRTALWSARALLTLALVARLLG